MSSGTELLDATSREHADHGNTRIMGMCQLESSQKRGGGCGCLHTRAPRKDVQVNKGSGLVIQGHGLRTYTYVAYAWCTRNRGMAVPNRRPLLLVRYMLFICYRLSMVMV